MKAGDLLDDAIRTLKASRAIDHWQKDRERIEAEELLADVMGGDEPEADDEVPARAARRFREMVTRRSRGEPLAYITGSTLFRGLEVLARPGVFVPRDSSEWLAEQAVRRLRGRRRPVHVDLATGGGTIALAVANEVRRATVVGSDLSAAAVRLARTNARRLGLRATFVTGDMFGALPRRLRGRVDVITLHPPYVPPGEVRDLPPEIRRWEPRHSLTDSTPDGLGLVARAAAEGPAWLKPGGWLLIEVSSDRTRDVARVLRSGGFRDVRSTVGGELRITRVVVGRRA
jgi:release factor glutamine methyltransferase